MRYARADAEESFMRIPFYFDYACPWAYLGSCRVEAYFQDLEIDFRPVRLADLKEPAEGAVAGTLGPRKMQNAKNDFRQWAELVGAEVSPDARGRRVSTRLLLQAALVAGDEGRFREFHYPAYRARWAEARDVSDRQVVRELLAGAGLDGDEALARAESDELDARLRADTQAAIERGVFGVPTMFVGDEMFWGNDRFELVRYHAQKAGG
ncbi:MAG: 2-hydroxychromene-2-carboxylate isomerase [Deltaproteobacteria bacterium]|nr:2-hydroxychromene-2-carboxylate isomerase [Deltaproteobacteria bacterium]MBW2413521.1 2-hydroxychromene-2-carboxylate isomerase [Deltaproteobacteria bacterium]